MQHVTQEILSCMPIVSSTDPERSLRFWVDGLGLAMTRPMHRDGRLIGCMVQNEHLFLWLNETPPDTAPVGEGIRLYLAPSDLHALRDRLKGLGYAVSEITDRDYGQTEFFVTDEDGHEHCVGVATSTLG